METLVCRRCPGICGIFPFLFMGKAIEWKLNGIFHLTIGRLYLPLHGEGDRMET